jgi:hypothetical protein
MSVLDDNLGGSTRPSIPGFQISTNQAEVRLTKSFGSEQILVVMNVNHSVDVEEDDGSPDSGKLQFMVGLFNILAPTPLAMPPLSVEITKNNKRLCFNLSLVEAGENGQFDFRVEEFYVSDMLVI